MDLGETRKESMVGLGVPQPLDVPRRGRTLALDHRLGGGEKRIPVLEDDLPNNSS